MSLGNGRSDRFRGTRRTSPASRMPLMRRKFSRLKHCSERTKSSISPRTRKEAKLLKEILFSLSVRKRIFASKSPVIPAETRSSINETGRFRVLTTSNAARRIHVFSLSPKISLPLFIVASPHALSQSALSIKPINQESRRPEKQNAANT